jgi:hypothetical protein
MTDLGHALGSAAGTRARVSRAAIATTLGAALTVAGGGPLVARQSPAPAGQDLILGTWTLNVSKSSYKPGPAPRSQTRTYTVHPDGIETTIQTTYADGTSTSIRYVAKYDGIEYPVTGSADADAIALKKIDDHTAEASLTHAGKGIGTARRVIAKDGRTMTISFRDPKGLTNHVAVYEKQQK